MTKIEFRYDFDRDVQNFIAGTRSKNSSRPTRLQQEYIDKHGTDYDESKVREFLKEYSEIHDFAPSQSINLLKERWAKIEKPFLSRVEKIFGITYPSPVITAYLTTNQRCTYNIEENYFFVNYAAKYSNRTIMHELLHFYTWHRFNDDFIKSGKSEAQYNDIKESMTELLNIEFVDLMGGAHDDGYPQHAEMRERISELWSKTKDPQKLIEALLP